MTGEETKITLTKGDSRLEFDQIVKSANGHLLAVRLIPRVDGNTALTSFAEGHKININNPHYMLGHFLKARHEQLQ
jgi:hypothetical protein